MQRLRRDAYVPEKPRLYRTRAKNAQEAHEAIRPTDFARAPQALAPRARPGPGPALRAHLEARAGEPDGERRDRPGERGHRFRRRPRGPARLRLHRRLRRLPAGLSGGPGRRPARQDGNGLDDDERSAAAGRRRASRWRWPASRPPSHVTEPPPRFSEASLVRRLEEARHRAPLHLCRDPLGAAGPQLCAPREAPLRAGGPRAHRHGVPGELLQPLCGVRLQPPRWKASLDTISAGEVDWRAGAERLLARLRRRRWRGTKGLRVAQVLDALDATLGLPPVPGRGRRARTAAAPPAARRQARAEARALRPLHRLRQLSRTAATPARSPMPRSDAAEPREIGRDPGDRPAGDPEARPPTASTSSAPPGMLRRRSRSASPCPRIMAPDTGRSRDRARPARAAARDRHPSRDRQAGHRRPRPLRRLRQA